MLRVFMASLHSSLNQGLLMRLRPVVDFGIETLAMAMSILVKDLTGSSLSKWPGWMCVLQSERNCTQSAL